MCLSLRRKEGPKRRNNFKPCCLAYEPWFIYGSIFFNNSISIFFASINRTFMEFGIEMLCVLNLCISFPSTTFSTA